jgi:hypothetical protein
MSEQIDLTGLDKADVLAALYNAWRHQGMGFLQARPGAMTRDEAAELLKKQTYFDYLHGKVMKVDLSGDTLDTWGYDRDLGRGAAARALESLRAAFVEGEGRR